MIEDITYLKNNSVQDSMSFYIDSGIRDKRYWPTPSEYSISFDQPFKLVYGFDILDAAIPTTQYNIDYANNKIAITSIAVPDGTSIRTAEPHMLEFSFIKYFIEFFENVTRTLVLKIDQSIVSKYSLDALSETLPDTTIYYALVPTEMNNVPIYLRTSQLDSEYFFFLFNEKQYAIEKTETATIDIISYANYALYFTPGSSRIVYYTKLKIDKLSYNTIDGAGEYIVKIDNIRQEMEIGNYDIGTLRNELNSLLNSFDLDFQTTTPIETKQGRYKITSSSKLLVLNGKVSTLADNMGFSEYPTPTRNDMYRMLKIGANPFVFYSIWDTFYEVYKIEAPGLVNLFGERYVVLKIKEIEDHLLGSYSYVNNSPGIGMFKLASNFNDVTNLRFDYVSLVRKPFHPIGKITRLTLRFETSKGQLYDFKGVNHQILMVVKFLVPSAKFDFNTSILNPNYDPNFIKYISSNQTILNKEDSDEEEEFDDEDNYRQYKKELDKYDFNEDGEDSEDDSEEDEENDDIDINRLFQQRRLLNA